MLKGITWGQFAGFASVLITVIYIWLIASGKLVVRAKGRQPPGKKKASDDVKKVWHVEEIAEENTDYTRDEIDVIDYDEDDKSFDALEQLADGIQTKITNSEEGISKEELLLILRKEIATYPTLDRPAFRAAINNLIIKAAKVDRSMELTKAETEALWGQI